MEQSLEILERTVIFEKQAAINNWERDGDDSNLSDTISTGSWHVSPASVYTEYINKLVCY